MTVERRRSYWWWDCTCGHFGYGPQHDCVLRAGVFHAHMKR